MIKKQDCAFTLIELLIVVAIIGILAAIAVPNFMNARVKATISAVQADFRTITQAADMYRLDWNRYPPDGAYVNNQTERPNIGYRALTTPVAYLQSHEQTRDRFARKNHQFKAGHDWDQFYEMGFSGWLSGRQDSEMKRDRYFIESVGPDGLDSIQGTRTYPARPSEFTAYHPSNGLKSTGDLYKAGGAEIPGWLPAPHSP